MDNKDMLNNWLNQLLNNNEYNKKISYYIQNNFTKSDNISYVPSYLYRDISIFRKIDECNCKLITITINEGMDYDTLLNYYLIMDL